MLDDETTKNLAMQLENAEQQRTPITQFSIRYPAMTIDDGYRIAQAWVAAKKANGAKVCGHKIGLTSRAMQQSAQINEPDYGTLLEYMMHREGSTIPWSRFIAPRVEAELAFVLGSPISGPDATIYRVLSATDYVVPAIEIIDSRIVRVDAETGRRRAVQDTIADNAASAAVVTGGRPVRPFDLDLRMAGVILSRNGVIEETGLAAGVLNHPANGIVWLANRLAPWGERLEAGETVLSGSFTRPVDAAPGDTFCADYGDLGSIAFRFGPDELPR